MHVPMTITHGRHLHCHGKARSAAHHVQAVVIGAGVIGLAVTRALAIRGKEVLLVDRGWTIGSETSSRNSEVIHAGIYYPTNSHKANFCVLGNKMLYEYCATHDIPVRKCGKLIVETHPQDCLNYKIGNDFHSSSNTSTISAPKQAKACGATMIGPRLQTLFKQALENGVSNVQLLSSDDVKCLEPEVHSPGGALYSPSTGVLDSHSLLQNLLLDAQLSNPDTIVLLRTEVEGGHQDMDGNSLSLKIDGIDLQCDFVVNCAGLAADTIAATFHQTTEWKPPKHYFAKGNYFRLQQQEPAKNQPPFEHLVYPLPDPNGGLGIHATIDWTGKTTRFGPDVTWLDTSVLYKDIDLSPDASRLDAFYEQIRTYWPNLPDNSIFPDYAGIRPKLYHPSVEQQSCGAALLDFFIAGPREHGIPGLFHLLGIESPGLTSCLSIANYIADRS